jgi:hypothetical protein
MTRALNAAPLAATRTRRIDWLYADRIPLRTGTILAGQGGIAKSTIISDVIAKATRGELPGTFYGTPVMVGIISPEDDVESVLVPRLMAAGANLENVVNLSVTASADGRTWTTLPNIADDLPAMGDLIRDTGIKLLVVDPLVSIMSGNSISQSDVRRNFDPLSALAKEHDFAVLAVAHFGKSGEKAGDRLSGSHAFRDIARVLIVAAVDEETGLRVLTVEKSNYSPLQPSDAYSIESKSVLLDDGHTQSIGHAVLMGASAVTVQDLMDRDRDQPTRPSEMGRVVDVVNANPAGVTVAEVVAALPDLQDGTVRRYLTRAAGRGDIERAARGVYVPCPNVPLSQTGMRQRDKETLSMVRESCLICGEPLHSTLAAQGVETHPNCDPQPVEASAEDREPIVTIHRLCSHCSFPLLPDEAEAGLEVHGLCQRLLSLG